MPSNGAVRLDISPSETSLVLEIGLLNKHNAAGTDVLLLIVSKASGDN